MSTLTNFEAVFSEAKAELDDAEKREEAFAHVERLSLAAHQTLLALIGGRLPRPGGHVYLEVSTPAASSSANALDVRY